MPRKSYSDVSLSLIPFGNPEWGVFGMRPLIAVLMSLAG
jgi:hypothetical protein